MPLEPPSFQEADRCDVCKCSFSTFRRRHHCRCCGRTLCHEHSSNQMALPQFGIHSNVRVCADCFNNSSCSKEAEAQASLNGVDNVTDSVSSLTIEAKENSNSKVNVTQNPSSSILECKCGMPLCICEAPPPSTDAFPTQKKATSTVTVQSNSKPKRTDNPPKNRGSTSNSRLNSVFNLGQVADNSTNESQLDYEVNGEGLREAIKNGHAAAVRKLLSQGVNPNFHDRQGMSLLHLAAVFNRTDIAFILMDYGASLESKNAQGETPLDCAPATLQYKMKMKMEESQKAGAQNSA